MRTPNESSEKLQKFYVQTFKILGAENFPYLFVISPLTAEETSLICFIAAAFLRKSNSFTLFFPFPPSLN